MSKVTYEICNRCGKKLNWKLCRFERIKATYILGKGPYDYDEVKLDLCDECADELKQFLSGGKK